MNRITRREALLAASVALAGQHTLTAEDWQEDLKYLAAQVESLHPGWREESRRKAFQTSLKDLEEGVGQQDELAIRAGLLRAFRALGDSHSGIPLHALFGERILPVGLYWFADGIYVAAAGQEAIPALGKRVLAIGGQEIEVVCQAVAGFIPHENEWLLRHRLPQYLSFPGLLWAAGVAAPGKATALRYKGGTVDLNPVDIRSAGGFDRVYDDRKKTPPLYRRNPWLAYWTARIEPAGTLYFHYGRCENEPSQPIAAFLQQACQEIESGKAARLIIDLRLNSGGDSSLLHPMVEFLRGSPVNRKGKLFGIIGRATYSSALINAVQLTQQTAITMVGEPTGGKPNHFGEAKQIILPRSKLAAFCSTRHFELLKADPASLLPQVRAEIQYADHAVGRDPFLELILQRVRN
jgi:hypothetical protein